MGASLERYQGERGMIATGYGFPFEVMNISKIDCNDDCTNI